MATYPSDQFDDLPTDVDRVGAHRGPKVKGRAWIGFGWAVLATVILTVAGLFALQILDGQISFTGSLPSTSHTPSATPKPQITPITDPTTIKSRHITVTVLNGTAVVGLQNKAATTLKAAKWKVTSTAVASTEDFKKTVVYYAASTDQDVALGIAEALGLKTVQLTDAYQGAPITVVLGTDYTG